VQQSGGSLDKAIHANAKVQAELLGTASPVIRDAIKAGKLKLDFGVYDLGSGKVTLG
jgi:carbonic anhydrase